ncbi:hypothetical protein GQ53DRAFT_85691 [Thozetella sp. PMI_491]|nr:hypothetical protein GQ53DRAFT_85691 [Thozetella sp. PMI_491]
MAVAAGLRGNSSLPGRSNISSSNRNPSRIILSSPSLLLVTFARSWKPARLPLSSRIRPVFPQGRFLYKAFMIAGQAKNKLSGVFLHRHGPGRHEFVSHWFQLAGTKRHGEAMIGSRGSVSSFDANPSCPNPTQVQ